MEPKLREYIENLFVTAPRTKQTYELKEEIIRNTIERYHDSIADGKTEADAFNSAIEGIGDVGELLEVLGAETTEENNANTPNLFSEIKSRTTFFKSIAFALYLLCITPLVIFNQLYLFGHNMAPFGTAVALWIVSVATGLLIFSHITKFTPAIKDFAVINKIKHDAVIKAVAIGMYISCCTPCLALGSFIGGFSVFFVPVILAAATVLIIYGHKNKTDILTDEAMVLNYKEWNSQKKPTSALYKIFVAILWTVISILYLIITVSTAIVAVSWIIFLLAVALQQLLKAIFDYTEVKR